MSRLKQLKYWLALPAILLVYLVLKGPGQNATVLVLRLILLSVCYAASLTDLVEKRVPNLLVAGLAVAWLLVTAPLFLFDPSRAAEICLSGGLGLAMAAAVMLAVYFVSRRGLGGGDVKLMSAAGLYLGYDGVLTALLYGSVLSAGTALALIALKKMTVKDAIPLVPFLYAGILLTEFSR